MSVNVKLIFGIIFIFSLINLASADIIFDGRINGTIDSAYWGEMYLYKYDDSAGSGTFYRGNADTIDIFTDDLTAGDYIAFGYELAPWHNLELNITTAVSADDIKIVWQFANSSGNDASWLNFSLGSCYNETMVFDDETYNFTLTGWKNFTFCVPDYFGNLLDLGGDNDADAYWIRALVLEVTNPAEGGKLGKNAFNGHNWAFFVDDGEYTPQDLYEEDLSDNSYNVTEHIGSYYFIDANLIIGNSSDSTNFTLTDNVMFEVGYPDENYGYNDRYRKRVIFHREDENYFTIGSINADNYTHSSSMMKYNNPYIRSLYGRIYNNWNGRFDLYGSIYYKLNKGFLESAATNFTFRNSIFDNVCPYILSTSSSSMYDTFFSAKSSSNYVYVYTSGDGTIAIDNIYLLDPAEDGLSAIVSGTSTVLNNVKFPSDKDWRLIGASNVYTCVDCEWVDSIANQILPLTSGVTFYNNYTLTIDVYNETGGRDYDIDVNITNGEGDKVYSKHWENSTQVTTYYEKHDTEIIDYNPFLIRISKVGYFDELYNVSIGFENKHMSITLGDYPFEVNGTIVLSKGKSLKFFK